MSVQGARPQPNEEEGDLKKPPAKSVRLSLPLLEKQLESFLLSRREQEVVHLVLQGFRNREIADRCFITEQTVKDHLKHVYKKVGVPTRTALIAQLLGLNRQP